MLFPSLTLCSCSSKAFLSLPVNTFLWATSSFFSASRFLISSFWGSSAKRSSYFSSIRSNSSLSFSFSASNVASDFLVLTALVNSTERSLYLRLGTIVTSLSISKSPPDLATTSNGKIIMLPAASGKNSYTSIKSKEFAPWVGIRTPNRVIIFLFSPVSNHWSFWIISFKRSRVFIGLPSLCFTSSNFLKSPCKAILTFIAEVGLLGLYL